MGNVMFEIFATATGWIALALIATAAAKRFQISIALMEICMGVLAGSVVSYLWGPNSFGANTEWIKFTATSGAVLLTFLAGAELEPRTMRTKIREVGCVGSVGFIAPFVGCFLVARFLLGWDTSSSLLTGIALSTTSMAVVYAVMVEYGFNKTDYGKGILGACFLNDLGTVLVLGIIFAPFSYKVLVFAAVSISVFIVLPYLTRKLIASYAHKTAAIRTKWVLFVIFGLGTLAIWAESEAVLPAYIAGMVLSSTLNSDEQFIRRLRTLTVGFLTPFYFIRAGSFVSLQTIAAAPGILMLLFLGKVISKIFGLVPVIGVFHSERNAKWYYTLLMSTGLTFGSISALYGYTHGIISQQQYSLIVAAVIASAVVPTMIANRFFLPRHLSDVPVPGEIPIRQFDEEEEEEG